MKGVEVAEHSLKVVAAVLVLVFQAVPAAPQTAISADGVVESTSGGLKFPDGSVQVSAGGSGTAPVEDSGQVLCYDATGTPRACSGTGEDGEHQAGVGAPAPRFSNNSDGTITDNLTGLVWLQDANCPSTAPMLWQEALDWVAQFNTTAIACDNYTAMTFTDWRLPNVKELASLADYGQGTPAVTPGHPFLNLQFGQPPDYVSPLYWSSTSPTFFATNAYALLIDFGGIGTPDKDTASHFVWPVRGGQ